MRKRFVFLRHRTAIGWALVVVLGSGAAALIAYRSQSREDSPFASPRSVPVPVANVGNDAMKQTPSAAASSASVRCAVGRPVPDCELPLLSEMVNQGGGTAPGPGPEKVRLSEFRGKKVVCLFLSSYT